MTPEEPKKHYTRNEPDDMTGPYLIDLARAAILTASAAVCGIQIATNDNPFHIATSLCVLGVTTHFIATLMHDGTEQP